MPSEPAPVLSQELQSLRAAHQVRPLKPDEEGSAVAALPSVACPRLG